MARDAADLLGPQRRPLEEPAGPFMAQIMDPQVGDMDAFLGPGKCHLDGIFIGRENEGGNFRPAHDDAPRGQCQGHHARFFVLGDAYRQHQVAIAIIQVKVRPLQLDHLATAQGGLDGKTEDGPHSSSLTQPCFDSGAGGLFGTRQQRAVRDVFFLRPKPLGVAACPQQCLLLGLRHFQQRGCFRIELERRIGRLAPVSGGRCRQYLDPVCLYPLKVVGEPAIPFVTRPRSWTGGVHARGRVDGHVHVPFFARDRNHAVHDRKLALDTRPLDGRPEARLFAALLGLDESAFETLVAVPGKVAGLQRRHPDERDRMAAHFGDAGAVGVVHAQMAEMLGRITTQKIAKGEPIGFPVVDELPFDDFAFTGLGPFFGRCFRKGVRVS